MYRSRVSSKSSCSRNTSRSQRSSNRSTLSRCLLTPVAQPLFAHTGCLGQVEAQFQTAEAENSKLQVALAAQTLAMPELVRMPSTDSKASEDQTESLLLLLESSQQLSEFREFVRWAGCAEYTVAL